LIFFEKYGKKIIIATALETAKSTFGKTTAKSPTSLIQQETQ